MPIDDLNIKSARELLGDISHTLDLIDETEFGKLGEMFDRMKRAADRAVTMLADDQANAEREAAKCKAMGIHNYVNGQCTTCERSEAECDCLPF